MSSNSTHSVARARLLASLVIGCCVLGLTLAVGWGEGAGNGSGVTTQPVVSAPGLETPNPPFASPFLFVPDQGQWGGEAAYRLQARGVAAAFHDAHVDLVYRAGRKGQKERGVMLRFDFEGALPDARPEGDERLATRLNWFRGSDPDQWHRNVPAFRRLLYRGVHPGIDLVWREGKGVLEYDLMVAPDADLSRFVIACQGADGLAIDDDGRLVIETGIGRLHQNPPLTWYELPSGEREEVTCRFRLIDGDRFGFALPEERKPWPLVVDPGLVWASYIGGSEHDFVRTLVNDGQGRVVVSGRCESTDFPFTPGVFEENYNDSGDMFLSRFSQDGTSLDWSTYIGGSGSDTCQGMALAPDGSIVMTGETNSQDLPVTPGAYDVTYNSFATGGSDICVIKVTPNGDDLVFCTYLGGTFSDEPYEPTVDALGNVAVPGLSYSPDYPTTPGAYDTTHNGLADGVVSWLDATGSLLLASTFIGGSDIDSVRSLGLGEFGRVVITGVTYSSDYPTDNGAFQSTFGGNKDGFLTQLDASLQVLVSSTFLGGPQQEIAYDLDIDDLGGVTVVGFTDSPSFPVTAGAVDTSFNGLRDVFVTRFDASGSFVLYSTFLGGSSFDLASTVKVDGSGNATIGGQTWSVDWPTTPGAFDTTLGPAAGAGGDSFIARLCDDGGALAYSTHFGGSTLGFVNSLDLAAEGDVLVGGSSWSTDFPATPGAFQTALGDTVFPGNDGWAAVFDLLPAGAQRYGIPTPGCCGEAAIVAEGSLLPGSTTSRVRSQGAPPLSNGVLIAGTQPWMPPSNEAGIAVNVNLVQAPVLIPVNSDPGGGVAVDVPLPLGTTGLQLYFQFAWLEPGSGTGPFPFAFSATKGLEIVVQ